jgi:hypothetical protein
MMARQTLGRIKGVGLIGLINVGCCWRHEQSVRFVSEQRGGIRCGFTRDISLTVCRPIGVSFAAKLAVGNRVWLRLRSEEIQGHAVFRATPNPALQRTGKSFAFPDR